MGFVRPRGPALAALAVGLCLGVAPSSSAQPADAPLADDTVVPVDAGVASAQGGDEALVDPRSAHVRSLIAGTLDTSVDPQALFDAPLSDELALQLEAARLRVLLEALEPRVPEPAPEAEAPPRTRRKKEPEPPAPPPEPLAVSSTVDKAQWDARVELDRARLDFYSLAPERRSALLEEHRARRQAELALETEEQRRAREAELERQQALEAARVARSEAERLVSEELARLIALETRVAAIRKDFSDAHEALRLRRDAVLGWQRRVRDAKAAGPRAADETYTAVRKTLRTARDRLDDALDRASEQSTVVPQLGDDPLASLAADIPTEHVRERRSAVAAALATARAEEHTLRETQAAELLDEIDTLNRERLSLLSHLSASKRDAITGFTAAGWDQARSEVRHLSLILRYHRYIAADWLASLRAGGAGGLSPWRAAAVIVPLLLLSMTFVWARARIPMLLRIADIRAAEADRAIRRTFPSPERRLIHFARKTHRAFEWAGFFLAVLWLLPASLQRLLEVQIISSIAGWMVGSAVIVNIINAVADSSQSSLSHDRADGLRLRSLRFVGRTVVVFGLFLVLSDRLVGQGTVYSWAFSSCWFAAIPVFLVLVSWWRGTVFERMERVRRKTPLEQWVLSNRQGWKSFVAATIGAVRVFLLGALKIGRSWTSRFDLVRRLHAYLFKRELDRLDDGRKSVFMSPLREEARLALHPERELTSWLSCPADEQLTELARRAAQPSGGVIALVGTRGMGKSSLLKTLQGKVPDARRFECTSATTAADLATLTEPAPKLVLLDDAHALVKPIIGGLAAFDELIVLARSRCAHTTWVLAFDASLWPFLKRARDARPMFDDVLFLRPWDESQIGALLHERNQSAGIAPIYDDLLDALPKGADEIDRLDALAEKQAGYERMLWDHVRGNPALALEAFRVSLAEDPAGVVHVRPLQLPDSSRLDLLPDSSLFVLRAVLQLTPANVQTVAQATRLTPEQVLNALRFGQTQGFLMEEGGLIRVTWPWLRAVTRLLERRHLLVSV